MLPVFNEHLADDVRRNDNAVGNQVAYGGFCLLFSWASPHTFSRTGLPSKPVGLTSSTTISTANTMASASSVEM